MLLVDRSDTKRRTAEPIVSAGKKGFDSTDECAGDQTALISARSLATRARALSKEAGTGPVRVGQKIGNNGNMKKRPGRAGH